MARYKDLTGQKCGRLTVVEYAGRFNKKARWLCRCECGKHVTVRADLLQRGLTKSCGCLNKDILKQIVHVQNLTGQKFGRLAPVKIVGRDKQRNALWLCKCECGKEHITNASSLRYGSVQSCGCLQKEKSIEASTTHGLSGGRKKLSRLYRIWRNMKSRCYNPNTPKFQNHGGRGIAVCAEWHQFEPFHKWAMTNGYAENLTLERIDNNGDYETGNCRWATYKEQSLNTRKNHIIVYKGRAKTLKEWADLRNMKYSTLKARIDQYKWTIEDALEMPVRERTGKREVINS